MSGHGTVLIRLQNLAWSANASDIRRFFNGLAIPEGGVHIVGGERGDAFVTFTSDETARLALLLDGQELCGQALKLSVSSNAEMQHVVHQARLAASAPADEPQPPTTPTPPLLREQRRDQQHYDRGYGRPGHRAHQQQRYYPEAEADRWHTSGGRLRHLPPDTAVAAYEDDDAMSAGAYELAAVPPEKRQRLDRGGDSRYGDSTERGERGWSRNGGRGGFGQAGYEHFYEEQHQHQHQRRSNGAAYQHRGRDEAAEFDRGYGSSSASARHWGSHHHPPSSGDAAADYTDNWEESGGGGPAAAPNAYSNIYGGEFGDSSTRRGPELQQQQPPAAAAPAYSSSRDPRLAARYSRESASEAAAIEESTSTSYYNEQRDPRFKGELYSGRAADESGESRQQHQQQAPPPIGSAISDGRYHPPSRDQYEAEDEAGYEYYSRERRGPGHQQRGGRGGGPYAGSYPPRPFDDYGGGGGRGGGEAEYGDSGWRRSRQHYEQYESEDDGSRYDSFGGGYRGPTGQQRGWRGRGRGGRGGPVGQANGYPPRADVSGGYRPKPWLSAGATGGPQLLPHPPIGDDSEVAAAFRRLLHPDRPKSLLGPAPGGPPPPPTSGRRPPDAQAGGADAGGMAGGEAPSRFIQPWQPPPMPELPQEALPDYTKGPRDEHFISLSGLPLDADYSDACAALPGIRLAPTDVKFETDAVGRRTGQAFVRLVEPADVLRALSQSVTDDNSSKVRVGASCEHEFRCANDPDFTGDEDEPDIGGDGEDRVEFPARPSPYYLDCCLEVNGLPQPIVAEDLLTVFGGDRSIADPGEDLHLDRSKDPNSVTAYLRFDGFERFAEATRRDPTELSPGAYLIAISRLQFADYRAASLRCEGGGVSSGGGNGDVDGGGDDDDNDEDEGRPTRDFRRPPIGFLQQQQKQHQKPAQFKKQKKPEKYSANNNTNNSSRSTAATEEAE